MTTFLRILALTCLVFMPKYVQTSDFGDYVGRGAASARGAVPAGANRADLSAILQGISSDALAGAWTRPEVVEATTRVISNSLADPRTERLLTNALSRAGKANAYAYEQALKRALLRIASYVAILGGFGFVCNGLSVAYTSYAEKRVSSSNCITATFKSLCNWQFLGGLTACAAGLFGMWCSKTPHVPIA